MRTNFTNPIYKELKSLSLIKDKNLVKISKKTRDAKIPVFKDRVSKIVFLQKYRPNRKYKKKIKSNLKQLNDDFRRVKQFNRYCLNKDVLDFGCGWGVFLSHLKKAKSLTGIELRNDCLNYIKKKNKKIILHKNLENSNEMFDIITLFHVLEHIPYQIDTLKKLKKCLKKKGKIIIEVPHAKDFLLSCNDLKEFKDFTFWSEHLILHTYFSLKKMLVKAGYKKIKISYFQRYNLNNHFGWLIKKKPGGHKFFKNIFSKKQNEQYVKSLIKFQQTDTLIAEASI